MTQQFSKYIPQPTASQTITENGTYDVVEKATAIVDTDCVIELSSVPSTKSKSIILVDGDYYLWKEA